MNRVRGGLRRRDLALAGLGAWALAACAAPPPAGEDRITDASGRRVGFDEVLQRLQACDVGLLGELHDNPHHHLRRARLMTALPLPCWVVAEHLPQGAAPVVWPEPPDDAALLRGLEAAGFEPEAWAWPLHRPLFAALAHSPHALVGGNLAAGQARAAARSAGASLPAEQRRLIDATPLGPSARQTLEASLRRGHCDRLPAERLPAMLWAQRGRDAAMAQAVLDRLADRATRPGPVLLLAGNAHVRHDHGVAQMLRVLRPGLRLVSIGFTEIGMAEEGRPADAHNLLWATPTVDRPDPCRALARA